MEFVLPFFSLQIIVMISGCAQRIYQDFARMYYFKYTLVLLKFSIGVL